MSLVYAKLRDSAGGHIRTLTTPSEIAEFERMAKLGEVGRAEEIHRGKIYLIFTLKGEKRIA